MVHLTLWVLFALIKKRKLAVLGQIKDRKREMGQKEDCGLRERKVKDSVGLIIFNLNIQYIITIRLNFLQFFKVLNREPNRNL